MRLDRSEIDIATLVTKIELGQIDIQPNFQRGEVWPDAKKKRLIDTILRNWYVPAIHIVVDEERDWEEVLDGQQRLRAILGFMHDQFRVDGGTLPYDPEIESLNGLYYSQLPTKVKARFDRFPISTVRLREFETEEPGELFFRLNQLTALTSAEQRNALIGFPRNQVKDLVGELEHRLEERSFGFANMRLSYDEVIARLISSFETRDLTIKLTARNLEHRYRRGEPFTEKSYQRTLFSIKQIAELYKEGIYSKLNKASLFSWLFFIGDNFFGDHFQSDLPREFFVYFEDNRAESLRFDEAWFDRKLLRFLNSPPSALSHRCASIFNNRTSARVNDVSSILLRDLSLNLSFADLGSGPIKSLALAMTN